MTREEIINEIKCLLSELNNGEDAVSYLTQNDMKWLNENIKALEQEPILDKIREEANKECISDGLGRYIRFDVLEQIIDKYKPESEEK